MTANSSGCYRFGEFELQPDERRLLASGTAVRVGRNAFDVLRVLVERSGHLVTKDQLFERVWPDLVVEENTLQAHVSALRKILGSEAIATVSGRGYRFTLDVTHVEAVRGPAPTHNLPHTLTSFIGRENEIAELGHLLGTTRLLTLTGAGGCGKTRLAMQVAADRVHAYPDGVWLVEFAALAEPALVAQTVAHVLGVKEQPGESPTQTIVDHLRTKHVLLLLDNAEHVLAACAPLVDTVLRACARIVVFVTSRERLGIAGELAFRVPSLSVPDPKKDVTPRQVLACESARLFVERARLQRPDFAVTSENAPALASICHRLDGIPLAIELAAPRIRSMSVEEVSRRLDQRFSLLTGGSRPGLPRHRTLRSLIDWSYDLLDDAEQALLRRVAVFSGGWALDAATQVGVDEGADAADVLDRLGSLVDKSLIWAHDRNGTTRYGLLETVRHYARDRLRESGEEARVQQTHFSCFLDLAREARPHLIRAEQVTWIDRLEMEHDNMRSALAWSSVAGQDVADGVALAGFLATFWAIHGHVGEGRTWLARLLANRPKAPLSVTHASAVFGAGVLAYMQLDYPAAQALNEESLAMRRELGDKPGIALALANLGNIAEVRLDFTAARALYAESLAIRRETGHKVGIAFTLMNLGGLANTQGDYPAARDLLEESLALGRELGDRRHIGHALSNLGEVALGQGDYPAARALLEEGLSILRELGDPNGITLALVALGIVHLCEGDYRAAQALIKEALRVDEERGGQEADNPDAGSLCGRRVRSVRPWPRGAYLGSRRTAA